MVGHSFKSSNYRSMIESLCPEVLNQEPMAFRSERFPRLKRLLSLDVSAGGAWISFSKLEQTPVDWALRGLEANVKPSDVHNIQFTSGTTGLPKGAMLTHTNVLMNAFCVGERLRYTEHDRVCVPVPFYHCFGCVLGTMVCTVYGSTLVSPEKSFDSKATLEAIASERCTSIYGVPTMFVAELGRSEFESYDLSHLRTGIMSGAPCPLPLMREVLTKMNAREICIGYGQTEASPIITLTSVDDPIEVRVGTVGRSIPGIEVKLMDPVTGQESQTGELWVRGHVVMKGYYNNPEATSKAVDSDGWLHTGDLASVREDGNYRIVGRSKELIIRGGENIHPPEIEEFLHHHPAVGEVAIVGLPDRHYGEVVSAWIVPKAGLELSAEHVREYCQGQIAHFKIPCYVQIVEQLPRTVTGKIRKHVLRERGIEMFGLKQASETPTA